MARRENPADSRAAAAWVPYVLPFALFMLLTEPARFYPALIPYLYIVKTVGVGALLWYWRGRYAADFARRLPVKDTGVAVACGLLVLAIWIVPEKFLYQFDPGAGFNPFALAGSTASAMGLTGVRLVGASVVVPIMEELFWRSFLMRYLVDPDFRSVPMGAFSGLSFLGVAILFGLEHHRIVVGIAAGLLYGLLLIRQKNLKGVILAHGVTNFGLGVYVVMTGRWAFW